MVLFKWAVGAMFVVTVMCLFIGMYFLLLNPPELYAGCSRVQALIRLPLPCADISIPDLEFAIRFLGALTVATAIYALYFISDRYGNL